MRTSQANRYARIAAGLAAAIALAVLGIYLRRAWQDRLDARNAPPPVPAYVEKTSQTFSYSKTTRTGTLFTIRAAHAIEFKDRNRTALQDVWISVYGADGSRADNIHTHACDYQPDSGQIVCAGEVRMELQSAEQAKRSAKPPAGPDASAQSGAAGEADPQVIHVITRGVSFDRDSGDASTDQPVDLRLPSGEIHAVGAKYHSQDGGMELLHEVRMELRPPAEASAAHKSPQTLPPIDIAGSSLEYNGGSHLLLVHGPVLATQNVAGGARELRSAVLNVALDPQFKVRHMIANGTPGHRAEIHSTGAGAPSSSILADEFVADVAPDGWIESLHASRGIEAEMKTSVAEDRMTAGHLDIQMAPKVNQPRVITATESVRLDAQQGELSRHLDTSAVRLNFADSGTRLPGQHSSLALQHLETLAPGTLTWQEPFTPASTSSSKSPARALRSTRLTARKIEMDFGAQNRLSRLLGHNGSEVERTQPGQPPQTSASKELEATFDSAGQWASIVQTGNVRVHSADRNAQADRGEFSREASLMTLSGAAQASDSQTLTTADKLTFAQTSSEMGAEGHVLTTYLKSSGAGVAGPNFGSQPAHVKSDRLTANSQTGKALYTGHARLWQADSTVEADEIELNRPANQIDARGNVHGLFLQAASAAAGHVPGPDAPVSARKTRSPERATSQSARVGPNQPSVWHVTSGTLTYWQDQARAHLDHGFQADAQDITVNAQSGDLFFTPAAVGPGGGTQQRIDHATASGNVHISQDDRRGTAEHGEYLATEGKVVLSGGTPTLSDTSGNTTTGRQLTFYIADDTILVQSEEGSKTVRRRIEK